MPTCLPLEFNKHLTGGYLASQLSYQFSWVNKLTVSESWWIMFSRKRTRYYCSHTSLNVSLFDDALITGKTKHCKSFSLEQTAISAVFMQLVQGTSKRTSERVLLWDSRAILVLELRCYCTCSLSPMAACE